MSIRFRVRAGITLTSVIFLALGVWIYATAQRINHLIDQSILVDQIVEGAFNLSSLTIEYILSPGERAGQQWNTRYSTNYILINSLEMDMPEMAQTIDDIREQHETLGLYFNRLVSNEIAYEEGQIPAREYENLRGTLFQQIVVKLQVIATDVSKLANLYASELLILEREIVWLVLAAITVMVAVVAAGGAYIDKEVVQPISSLTQTAQSISEGDLSARAHEKRKDEIGVLAQTFNQMTTELKNSLENLENELNERERVSQELQQSEAKLRALLQAIPDAKFLLDWDATFLEFIPGSEFRPMMPPVEFLGKKAGEVLPVQLASQLHFYLQKAIETNTPQVYEYPLTTRETGEVRYFETRITVSGKNRALAIIREVTDRVETVGKIEQMNIDLERRVDQRTAELQATINELESFSYTISHDLRAPLRAMVGYTRLVMTENAGVLSEEAMQHLDRVYQNALRMGRMVDELLSFARLGRQSIQRSRLSETSLRRIIDVILAELREENQNRYVDVLIGELPPCDADPNLLQQVLVNLLSNAFKFTRNRDHAAIEIGHTDTANGPAYFVRDNGAGFDMQYASKLFGVFERLHSPGEFEGTGVGLAIVHRIITRHGGKVWAEAEPGKGACFYFTLPPIK